jgi:hypothetical protein
MTRDDDFIGQLEGYLDEYEGMTPLPEGIRGAVRAQLPKTRQIGPITGPMRYVNIMSKPAQYAIAAALVVLVAIVGIRFLTTSNVGSDATPTLTPTPTATPTVNRAVGALDPGTYYIDDPTRTPVRFEFTVPAGWTSRGSDYYLSKHSDEPGELGLSSHLVTHVYADACNSAGTLTEVGPTVDDLVRALVDQRGTESSTPVEVPLGGYAAKRIDLSIPAELDTDTCRFPGVVQIWADPDETNLFTAPAAGGRSSVYVVDVDGSRVVITAGYSPEASAADIAELDEIVASIRFGP